MLNRIYPLLVITLVLANGCGSNENSDKTTKPGVENPTEGNKSTCSISEQPAKTVMDFLQYYKANYQSKFSPIEANLVLEPTDKIGYRVNWKAVKEYQEVVRNSHFVSEIEISVLEIFFRQKEEFFIKENQRVGPPEGFETDIILRSSNVQMDLEKLNAVKILECTIQGTTGTVDISLENTKAYFHLDKIEGKWLIREINDGEPMRISRISRKGEL